MPIGGASDVRRIGVPLGVASITTASSTTLKVMLCSTPPNIASTIAGSTAPTISSR